jgi:hypothetical protein
VEGTVDIRVNQFVAVLLTALALIPGGAHALELANKLALDQDHYLIVQSVYFGWALGIILIAALAANFLLAIRMRRQSGPMLLAAMAATLISVTLVIFFTWTLPANPATANWIVATADWQSLRLQWEFSPAVNAGLTFLAFCATTLSAVVWSR